jgi:energy-coupling factor transport system ATP-binding protein
VLDALRLVELDPEVYGRRDPFTLSGGEQRRLALAVLLARRPRVLILDEPSAGLDGPGRQMLYDCIKRARREQGTSVVLVSHDLEEVAANADRVYVLSHGRIAAQGRVEEVLQDADALISAGLTPPPLVRVREALAAHGYALPGDWSSAEAASRTLAPALGVKLEGEDGGRA